MSHSAEKKHLAPHCCEIPGCDFSDYVQRHRIKPGAEGGKYRLGNVIALCPNHHAYADDGKITRHVMWEIVRRRLEDGHARGEITDEVFANSVEYVAKVYAEPAPA